MYLNTTVNVHSTILDKILLAVKITGQSKNTVMNCLLRQAMCDSRSLTRYNRLVKYQDRDPLKRWEIVHIRFDDEDNVFSKDMRRFCCLSVSFILAFAVRKYLNVVIKKLMKSESKRKKDNYPFSSYEFMQEVIENGISWKQTWKLPQKPEG